MLFSVVVSVSVMEWMRRESANGGNKGARGGSEPKVGRMIVTNIVYSLKHFTIDNVNNYKCAWLIMIAIYI